MRKRKKVPGKPAKALDTFSEKRGRGRPETIQRSSVIGRANNYRFMLTTVWAKLRLPLLAARSTDEIRSALENYAQPYASDFDKNLTPDILALIRDSQFPKREKAQIGFLADSLGGRPTVTARTSRDICAKERAKENAKSPHSIIRKEFYVECSCGYKGPALSDACRKCGAPISYLADLLPGV
jgi:hypothetical protein